MDYCLEYLLLNDENHIYKEVNYYELMDLINGFHTGIIYIGGPWCKNCQAIISLLNEECKRRGITEIYNYDSHFINDLNEEEDLRACLSLETKTKYYDLVEKIGFNNTTDELVENTLISLMHVPFIIAYKDGICQDFFSMEIVYDNGQYLLNEEQNADQLFISRLNKLIDRIE